MKILKIRYYKPHHGRENNFDKHGYRFHIQAFVKASTSTLEIYLRQDHELPGRAIHYDNARTGRFLHIYYFYPPLLSFVRPT